MAVSARMCWLIGLAAGCVVLDVENVLPPRKEPIGMPKPRPVLVVLPKVGWVVLPKVEVPNSPVLVPVVPNKDGGLLALFPNNELPVPNPVLVVGVDPKLKVEVAGLKLFPNKEVF